MFGYVYLIRNSINGKGYVGKTLTSLSARFRRHRFEARKGSKQAIHCAIRKYGIQNFTSTTILACAPQFLNEMESYFIQSLNTHADRGYGYNLTFGGDGVPGLRHSLETRAKMSESHKNRKRAGHSLEARANMSRAHEGKTLSETHKARIALAGVGRTHSIQTRVKMGESQLRRFHVN